ncbi:MAG: nitrite/sulfite reductase, partial [Acidimicrobiales bacterium]
RRLEHVGITTLQACGDSARNVLCCPVAGIDADEAFDALPVAQAISDFFTGNREYANLPRKFKISATGCLDDCAQAEINDVGLRPARDHHGELGFNVVVGGGLSDGPRLASDIDVFVGLDQAVELTRAIAQTWGELGNRENRGQSRMRYLVQELGPERFREELAVRCSFALTLAGTSLTRRYRGDHVGVHRQRQAGLSYVGLNVTVGRIQGTALMEAARLAETYGDGGIRLATDQNLIVTGVGDAALPDLLAEPLLRVHSPNPGPFERGAVACTGTEYCRFAIVETKQRMASWARELDRSFPPLGGDRGIVRIHLSGCSASCAQPQIADIGLRGDIADKDGRMVEALDIGLGGSLGTDAAFIDWVEGAKPADEVPGSLTRLLVAYQAQANPGERFYEWARRVPNGDLRGLIAEVSS